jgi:uncharacterized protein (TIGR00730 family)
MATICVYCSSSELIPEHYLELAAALGREVAARGHALVTGGGSVSCMGAVARGARDAGGRTIGVIPEALRLRELADLDAHELIVTADMRSRKGEMDRRADGFIVLPGGLGTLEELLEIWTARTLGMHNKPIVVLDPDGHFAPLREQVAKFVATGFAFQAAAEQVSWAAEVGTAIDGLGLG